MNNSISHSPGTITDGRSRPVYTGRSCRTRSSGIDEAVAG